MGTTRLTEATYWEAGYAAQREFAPLRVDDYRHLAERRLIEQLEGLGLSGRNVLEIGAGDSAILTYLARVNRGSARFSGLDYSEIGCRLLAERARREEAEIEVIHDDLFQPPARLIGRFDLVYSLGVVEHFQPLGVVLTAMRQMLAPGGTMFTLIPNMAGLLGTLTKHYNKPVFEQHIPHTLSSFLRGHVEAGLTVQRAGYLCSTNFGVLSACFSSPADRGWSAYKWLSRLTKVLWLGESRVGDLPHTALLSPYLYAVSVARG